MIILKYKLNIGESTLMVPSGTQFLSAHAQDDAASLWAIAYDNKSWSVQRRFFVTETGQPFRFHRDELEFIGTVLFHNGSYVQHVFEILS